MLLALLNSFILSWDVYDEIYWDTKIADFTIFTYNWLPRGDRQNFIRFS